MKQEPHKKPSTELHPKADKMDDSIAIYTRKVSVSTIGGRSGNIEDQPYYHGFRPRRECENLIKEPGDWLLRATDGTDHSIQLVITLMDSRQKIMNLTLAYDEQTKWGFAARKRKYTKGMRLFPTVVELIEHYRGHRLGREAQLKHGITRPTWLIKHASVRYDQQKDFIGAGNFCNVYRGRYEKDKGDIHDVAVKICHGADHASGAEEAASERKSMLREAELMSFYSHPNVIRLFGVACDHQPVLIVMEFCPGGNLQSHLLKHKEKIEVSERVRYLREIADFGLSRLVEQKKEEGGEDFGKAQIPLRWMAPESLRRNPTFSLKTDVWSFGILMYEVFAQGEKPWPDDEPKKIATWIRRGEMPTMPKSTPEECLKMLKMIWSVNPDARPSMQTLALELRKLYKHLGHPHNPVINVIKARQSETGSNGTVSQLSDDEEPAADRSRSRRQR